MGLYKLVKNMLVIRKYLVLGVGNNKNIRFGLNFDYAFLMLSGTKVLQFTHL